MSVNIPCPCEVTMTITFEADHQPTSMAWVRNNKRLKSSAACRVLRMYHLTSADPPVIAEADLHWYAR
jgi:hypothetical protein